MNDTDKAFEEEPMQIRLRIVAREFKSGDRPDSYAGIPRWKVCKVPAHCCESQSRVLTQACRSSRAHFHVKVQGPVLVKLPAEDCSGRDKGKIGLLKKSMYGTRDAASNSERGWQRV